MTAELLSAPASLAELPQLADGILCDILFPSPPADLEQELLTRRQTGYSFTSLTLAQDNHAAPSQTYAALATVRHQLSLHPDDFIIVDTVADIREAKRTGKIGVGFHFQGTESIGRDLANVGAYYKLGVRWMLMAYNFQNNVGVGCIEAQKNDGGLSAFGRDLIAEMNRVGMIVDCSHSGYRTTMDAMETSTQPCIFSHSNPLAIYQHPRNIRDDQAKACAATGGVIGVNGVGQFIGEADGVKLDTIVRIIDYYAELVGPQHIALGLDYMTPWHTQVLYDSYKGNVAKKIGMPELPWAFLSPSTIPQLLQMLLDKGYSAEDLRGIIGDNFLRVAEAVWK